VLEETGNLFPLIKNAFRALKYLIIVLIKRYYYSSMWCIYYTVN